MALTKLNNNSLHAITDGSALKNVTGSVLQVVQNTGNSEITCSDSDTDIISGSITPVSSSSKILVMTSAGIHYTNILNLKLKLKRTAPGSTATLVARGRHGYSNVGDHSGSGIDLTYLDSPGTTSQCTYKMTAAKSNSGGTACQVADAGGITQSNAITIILMEIAG